VKPQKYYIAFKKGKNVTDIAILKKSLKLFINVKAGQLDDPRKIAQDVSNIGHWGNGDYQLQVDSGKNLEYIMSLVKQAIKWKTSITIYANTKPILQHFNLWLYYSLQVLAGAMQVFIFSF